jgi:type VI secretion system protein ImpI/type VI secretion system protein
MTLTLSVLRCPDAVPPETKRISGGEFRIGRGPDNDWIMPDPDRMLSKKHCVVAFRNGGWAIADTSTNGTFLNRDAEPIGAGQVRGLQDGDRIRLGAYEIEVRVEQESSFAQPRPGGASGASQSSPFDDPFGDDVFASRPPPAETFVSSAFGNDPLFGATPPTESVTLPPRYDPLAPVADDDFFGAPTVPDHSQSFSDAFRPPPAAPKLIPDDDWDLGFSSAPAPPRPEPPVAVPVAAAASLSPFTEPEDDPAPPPVQAPPVPPVAPPPETPVAPATDLLAAFLAGAGMSGRAPENPTATMQAVGAAFRATVSGIRQALIARSSIKGEFRIEQTMIRARGNNPLKFSADDDDALSALLGIGRRTDVTAEAAVTDALRDMRLHELATIAAMQGAVRKLLADLDPAKLLSEATGGMLPAQKKAKAFEAYEKRHETVTRALADDFDSVFGKAFARAYEAAMRDISARET